MWILILIVIVILAYFFLCLYLFDFAVVNRHKGPMGPDAQLQLGSSWDRFMPRIREGRAWFFAQDWELIRRSSRDGLELTARFLPAEGARGTLILMHGYRTDPATDFSCGAKEYHEMGFNLLAVSQRAHELSQGRYICYGSKERFDCRMWSEYIAQRFGPEHDIFLCGMSMGASTVLMTAGLELPENVRGVVADCGFTSAWEEISYLMKTKYHLPVHPILDTVNLFARVLGKFSFREASTLDAMRVCRLPVLLIHGEADKFVPCRMSRANFEACAGKKALITVPGAGHGASFLVEHDRYLEALKRFFAENTRAEA